jgi:vacuolar-type H+-ATPase subunit H
MALTEEEKKALIQELGKGAVKEIDGVVNSINSKMESVVDEVKKTKGATEEQMKLIEEAQKEGLSKFEEILKKQGKTIGDIQSAVNSVGTTKGDSIAEVLSKHTKQLADIFKNGQGVMSFEVSVNKEGKIVARPHDASKAAYTHATIDDVDNPANVASIAQSLDAASILRLGGDAEIINQYRNSPYIFDLVNTFTTSNKLAIWINEVGKEGGSTTVTEGATKPKSQYFYELKAEAYKKEATLLTFTEEFDMDFGRLQQNAISSARIDLTNRINSAILPRLFAAATAYNTGATFAPLLNQANPNDFMALAAMAAQAESATFGGARANAALMSTYKKYAMGLLTDDEKAWLNTPDVLRGLSFIGNPEVGADDVIVGDFKQYNVMLRGGMIMKVGHNGTDFAENKFSVVIEQYYFD